MDTRAIQKTLEVDITHLSEDFDTLHLLCGKHLANGDGKDGEQFTWANAMDYAEIHPLIDSQERRDAVRAFLKGFGEWPPEDLYVFDDQELSALLTRLIAYDLREVEEFWDGQSVDWERVDQEQDNGRFSSRIWVGFCGQVFYYIGE
jgi:hypothetical protein